MIDDIPEARLEQAQMMLNLLIARATGSRDDDGYYGVIRRGFIEDPQIKPVLPDFVRSCRDLTQFWAYIKDADGSYAGRRAILYDAFVPLFDYLEASNRSPADQVISDTLKSLNADQVSAIWSKALERRTSDPEGAITSGRQLLETVCKLILDDLSVDYPNDADLPKLWGIVSKELNLSPSQHTEQVFKSILGGCHTVVQNIGAVRNRIGDAHGQGRSPVKPAPRHAALVVNLSGSMALFLVETYIARQDSS